jgi:hypothetical protein
MEWALKKVAVRLPLTSDGAYAFDSTPWWFYWNDHGYGSGWLQADNALFGTFVLLKHAS